MSVTLNERYRIAENAEIERIEKLGDIVRRCEKCSQALMNDYEMYLLEGTEHYCSFECLCSRVTEKEWGELCDISPDENNYTTANYHEFENENWADDFNQIVIN